MTNTSQIQSLDSPLACSRRRDWAVCGLLAFVVMCMSPLTVAAQESSNDSSPGLPFWLVLRDGTRIQIHVENGPIQWRSVSRTGEITQRDLTLDQVASISLTSDPASLRVARIRALVSQLGDTRYEVRQEAEQLLKEEGGPFKPIIEKAQRNPDREVRYRAKRIIGELDQSREKLEFIEFDRLTLVTGEQLEGDIGAWQLHGEFNGQQMTWQREQMYSLDRPTEHRDGETENRAGTSASQPVRWRPLTDDSTFFQPGQVDVSFDEGPHGQSVPSAPFQSIDDFFAFLGCLLSCENEKSHVIISAFEFTKSHSKEHSIGNYKFNPETKQFDRYQGIMNVRFCQPWQKNVPASVEQVGCFVEIVEPRQTIMEGYNAAGHMVGMAECKDKRYSFVGLQSSDPIVRVRILANHDLPMEDKSELNVDFAVDDLCYSRPVVSLDVNTTAHYSVRLRDGHRFFCGKVEPAGDRWRLSELTFTDEPIEVSVVQLLAVLPPAGNMDDDATGIHPRVMLDDGSVIEVEVDADIKSVRFPSWSFPSHVALGEATASQPLLGIWGSQTVVRYPQPDDFDEGRFVAVLPTFRVAFDQLQSASPPWTADWKDGRALIQNRDPDSVPPELIDRLPDSIDIAKAPCIWFQQPVQPDPRLGQVLLKSGIRYVLGGSSGFQLQSIDDQSVIIARGADQLSIPFDAIQSLRFAN